MKEIKVPEDLKRQENETYSDYKKRIVSCKKSRGLTWNDVRDYINSECNLDHDESVYRKYYKQLVQKGQVMDIDAIQDTIKEDTPDAEELSNLLSQIQKERMKLSDERVQNNAILRRLSREETLIEIAKDAALTISDKKIPPSYTGVNHSPKGTASAILTLSDWHYGIVCDNYWNKYDPDIAELRIAKLKDKVIQRCLENNCKEIFVVNLSDLISGRIHLSIRLQNRIDVITQIIRVSEIMAEFLTDLSKYMDVHYYDCLDNHSRLEPNKKDSLDLETLVRITPWYLKARLTSPNIHIHNNEFGDDIISFNCRGYEVIGVHGDNDKPIKVVDNLTLLTHKHYDLVLTAHLHHFGGDEKNQTMVISNGSLMGTDSYAEKLRLSSRPSQNLIIATEDSVAEAIYRILLD